MENRFDISDIRRPDRAAALFMALSIFCLPSCSDRIGPPETQGQELMRISLATSGVEESASPGITKGEGWFVTGGMINLYMVKNGAGNNDSRILRFKKSDVEYIY